MDGDTPSSQNDPGKVHWSNRRLWQIQPIRDCLLIAGVIALVMLGAKVSVVTVPLGLALILAYLFEPVIRRLSRPGWLSREGAAIGVIAFVIFLVAVPVTLALIFAIGQGLDYSERFATNISRLNSAITAQEPERAAELEADLPSDAWRWISENVREYRAAQEDGQQSDDSEVLFGDAEGALLSGIVSSTVSYLEAHQGEIGKRLVAEGFNAVAIAISFVTSVGFLLFTAFLTAFFFFFCSTGYGALSHFWESLIPERNRERWLDLLQKMDGVIAAFIRGRLVIAIIQSALFTIAYWLIGVPAPMILGPLVGFLSIVPYLALAGIPVSVGLLVLEPGSGWQGEGWWIVGAPIAVYFLLQDIDDYVLTPTIQGKGTGMDTPTILFATIAGGALLGVFGMLLAIPIAACMKILIVEVYWPKFKEWTEGNSVDPLPFGPSGGDG